MHELCTFYSKIHFLEKCIFLEKANFFVQFFFRCDRERKYLFKRICKISRVCTGIAITNEITYKLIFHT